MEMCRLFLEGILAVTYSEGAPEMKEGSFRVRAMELTRVYYLTNEDKCRLEEFFPLYAIARAILRHRSYMKHKLRKTLFDRHIADRINHVDLHFRPLLRAPLQDLTDFLRVKDEIGKTILETLQEKMFSRNRELYLKHN